jgi:hypothetical protein
MDELRLYPSGFRGTASVRNTKPIDMERARHRFFSSSAVKTPEGRSGNLEVAQIWEAVSSGAAEVKTFEFHERVLKAAVKAFGCTFIYDWICYQRKSPNWDEYHQRWIDETLQFVIRGKPRQFSSHNWVGLLDSDGQDVSQEHDSQIVNEVFYTKERVSDGLRVSEFIQRWLQQPHGFEDLTESLYVLFGNRGS